MAAVQPLAAGSSSGSFHPLPGSWSFDVSLLAAARLGSHSEGEGEAGDGFPPLPTLPRSKSVGRSLLSRFSRGGEASSSPTGLGFRYLQQQQQQQQQVMQRQAAAVQAAVPQLLLQTAQGSGSCCVAAARQPMMTASPTTAVTCANKGYFMVSQTLMPACV
jgi:hypothetical protein